MSLANIQELMLNLTIQPHLTQQLYTDPERLTAAFPLTPDELDAARRLPQQELEDFQYYVALKRMRRNAHPYVKRTMGVFPIPQRKALLRQYLAQHEMRGNEWNEHVQGLLTFFRQHMDETTSRGPASVVVNEFEQWMFACSHPRTETQAGSGFVASPNVHVRSFPLPAEPLIAGNLTWEILTDTAGTVGYVLAQWTGRTVDLYEVDAGLYQLIAALDAPVSRDELFARANELQLGADQGRTPGEVVAELIEIGIVVETEAAAVDAGQADERSEA